MSNFRLRLGCLVTSLMLYAGAWASDNSSVSSQQIPSIYNAPSGSYFSYNGNTVFLPGTHLPQSVLHPLLVAGSDVAYRKLMHYLMQFTLERTAQYLSENTLMWCVYQGTPLAPEGLELRL